MTEKEATRKTRYFSEGVSAEIWCYARDGQWLISINRAGAKCSIYGLDSLKRSILCIHNQVLAGEKELRLFDVSNERYEGNEIEFHSVEDARNCVNEIMKALEFVQSETSDEAWHEVPATILADFGRTPIKPK